MKNMHILSLALLSVILAAGACQKTPDTGKPDNIPLSLSAETVEIGAEGGSHATDTPRLCDRGGQGGAAVWL